MLSDIEDGDESDNSDDESLRPRNSITTDEGSFSSRSSSATESRDDSVVGPLNDGHHTTPNQARQTIHNSQQLLQPALTRTAQSAILDGHPSSYIAHDPAYTFQADSEDTPTACEGNPWHLVRPW